LFNLAIPPRIVENTGHQIRDREMTRTQGIAEAFSASLAKQFQAQRGRLKVTHLESSYSDKEGMVTSSQATRSELGEVGLGDGS
jgi:hypothetical protein